MIFLNEGLQGIVRLAIMVLLRQLKAALEVLTSSGILRFIKVIRQRFEIPSSMSLFIKY